MDDFVHVLTDNWDIIGPHFWETIKLFLIAAVGSVVLGTLLAAMRVSPCRRCAGSAAPTCCCCATPR
ncbi:hypothetical protein GCM10027610_138180 [Dactylosporangium cerinum]